MASVGDYRGAIDVDASGKAASGHVGQIPFYRNGAEEVGPFGHGCGPDAMSQKVIHVERHAQHRVRPVVDNAEVGFGGGGVCID